MYFIIVMIFSPISAVNEDADHPYLVSSFDSNQMINQRGGWSDCFELVRNVVIAKGRQGTHDSCAVHLCCKHQRCCVADVDVVFF